MKCDKMVRKQNGECYGQNKRI